MIRLAINGFGRIGRLAFRKAMELENFEVVAINDLASPSMLAYLLKYDSVQGAYLGNQVDSTENSLVVDGNEITIYKEPDASNLPWKELNIDLVLECTGFYTSKAKAQAHLDAGAGKVLISAPAGNDMKTIVYGVNHETLTAEVRIVSGASCTTNCLAPMAKALNDYREVRTGFMTTIHAYTGNQKILDAPDKRGQIPEIPCGGNQHRTDDDRCGAGYRKRYSGAGGKTNWFGTACSGGNRIHHHSGCDTEGSDGQRDGGRD